jgi:hypothetical protein
MGKMNFNNGPPNYMPTGTSPEAYVKDACDKAKNFGCACTEEYLKTLMAVSASDVAGGNVAKDVTMEKRVLCSEKDLEKPIVASICKAGCKDPAHKKCRVKQVYPPKDPFVSFGLDKVGPMIRVASLQALQLRNLQHSTLLKNQNQ